MQLQVMRFIQGMSLRYTAGPSRKATAARSPRQSRSRALSPQHLESQTDAAIPPGGAGGLWTSVPALSPAKRAAQIQRPRVQGLAATQPDGGRG